MIILSSFSPRNLRGFQGRPVEAAALAPWVSFEDQHQWLHWPEVRHQPLPSGEAVLRAHRAPSQLRCGSFSVSSPWATAVIG